MIVARLIVEALRVGDRCFLSAAFHLLHTHHGMWEIATFGTCVVGSFARKSALKYSMVKLNLMPIEIMQPPDGATIIPWYKSDGLIRDYTCTDTFAVSYLNMTKECGGAAAVQRKHHVQ